jgi:SlyX protein
MADLETRITDLEIRLAHQEAAIDEITKSLLQNEKQITKINLALVEIKSMVASLGASNIAPASEETPPPHY